MTRTDSRGRVLHRAGMIVAALAGLAAAASLIAGYMLLNPGGSASTPQPAAGQSGLGSAIRLTGSPEQQLPGYLMIAAVVLLIAFSVQLAARVGAGRGAAPRASAFIGGLGTLIAVLVAVETGLAFGLAETALAREDSDLLFAYYTWEWWFTHVLGVVFIAMMLVVSAVGVHEVVLARLARWSTLALAVAMAVVTSQGLGGMVFLFGTAWIAALSIGMALHAVMHATERQVDTTPEPA